MGMPDIFILCITVWPAPQSPHVRPPAAGILLGGMTLFVRSWQDAIDTLISA
jgi:hypothetical protein